MKKKTFGVRSIPKRPVTKRPLAKSATARKSVAKPKKPIRTTAKRLPVSSVTPAVTPSNSQMTVRSIATRQIKTRKKAQQTRQTNWRRFFKILLGILAGLVLFVSVVGVIFIAILMRDLPNVHDLQSYFVAESTQIFDREGNLLYTIHGDENREIIQIFDRSTGEIKPEYTNIVMATLAIEDDQFFEHSGFDLTGIFMSLGHEAFGDLGGIFPQRGGSTITQQFIKMSFLSAERSYIRKAKEIILAVQLEHTFSKNEILEMYLNKIPYGNNAYGVEMAAKTYFGKSASELNLGEAAILASIPNAPSRYNPYGNGRDLLMGYYDTTKLDSVTGEQGVYVLGRKDLVLQRLKSLGWITTEEKDTAWKQSQETEFIPYKSAIKAPHFVFYVRQLLEEKYGADVIQSGGLKIYTTLDPNLQNYAEELLTSRKAQINAYGANNAALLSADPKTGQILAMVGSLDYWDETIDGNVNVTLRPRLPGSSFKPYAYAAGFLQGYGPGTVFYDVQTDFGQDYKPENYDGTWSGPVTARHALNYSLNIPAVKMAVLAGVDNILNLVYSFGINSLEGRRSDFGPSLALGAGEITMFEHVQGYSVFANGGNKIPLTPILKVMDNEGNLLEQFEQPEGEEVLDPQVAYEVVHILSDMSERPAWSTALRIPGQVAAWKSGTSNKKDKNDENVPSDTWLMGFTPDIVTGVWSGNTDGSALGYNATGATTVGTLWRDFMVNATKDKIPHDFEKPQGLSWVTISDLSGKVATEDTPEEHRKSEMFASFSVPTETDDSVVRIKVDKATGLLPTDDCAESALEYRTFYDLHSLRPDLPKWEEAVRDWQKEKSNLALPPTEYTSLCSSAYSGAREEVPTIAIISPQAEGVVSAGTVGVNVNINSTYGVERVEYYLDGEKAQISRSYPYKGTLTIPEGENTAHTIRVVMYDPFLNKATAEVSVRVGTDTTPPVIAILSPEENASVKQNSTLTIQTKAYDNQSDLKRVEFYIGTQLIDTVTSSPFNLTFPVVYRPATYQLTARAFDLYGNSAEASITFKITEPSTQKNYTWDYGDTPAVFLAPSDGTHLPVGVDAQFSILLHPNLDVKSVEVLGKRAFSAVDTKRYQVSLASISKIPDSGQFLLSWLNPTLGDYQVFIKVTLADGTIQFTNSISIIVE